MTRGLNDQAYTILEVLIVLAVTGALLVSAMIMISGQQQKTEFSQAVQDINSKLIDISNDVTTGYYANSNNFSCTSASGSPSIDYSASSNDQGTNAGCIFMGRVVQFGKAGSSGQGVTIYNVIGSRTTSSGADVENLSEAKPLAIADTSLAESDITKYTENLDLRYGLTIDKMYYDNGAGPVDISAFGFLVTNPSSSTAGLLDSGSPSVDIVPIPGTAPLGQTVSDTAKNINKLGTVSTVINPSNGVVICFNSGGTNQSATFTIGSYNRKISVDSVVTNGKCS